MNSIALRLLDTAASTVDRAFVAAIELRNRAARARAESLSHEDRLALLGRIQQAYGAPALITDPDAAPLRSSSMLRRERNCSALSWRKI